MTHEITLSKGRDGWEAKTTIMLPGVPDDVDSIDGPCPAFLTITTGKPYGGKGLRASGMTGYKTPHGFRCKISFAGDGDWSRNIITEPTTRCTEKSVRELHTKALAVLPTILGLIADHYKIADPLAAEPVPA